MNFTGRIILCAAAVAMLFFVHGTRGRAVAHLPCLYRRATLRDDRYVTRSLWRCGSYHKSALLITKRQT
jgi:hypothetical protein